MEADRKTRISGADGLNLKNRWLGVELECLPEFGGRLNYLQLQSGSLKKNLLAGFSTVEDLKADPQYTNVLLFPFSNRLQNGIWHYKGEKFQFPQNDDGGRPNALHGFLFNKPFEIVSTSNDENGVSVELKYCYRADFTYYPFELDVVIRYRIQKPDTFQFEFLVENLGDVEAPVSFGWHPYFDFGEDVDQLVLQTPSLRKIEVDENLIPTGKTLLFNDFRNGKRMHTLQIDNCFYRESEEAIHLTSPEQKIAVEIQPDENFPYVHFYIPPHRKQIAIESVTSNINAFQNGDHLRWIDAGNHLNGKITLTLKSLAAS